MTETQIQEKIKAHLNKLGFIRLRRLTLLLARSVEHHSSDVVKLCNDLSEDCITDVVSSQEVGTAQHAVHIYYNRQLKQAEITTTNDNKQLLINDLIAALTSLEVATLLLKTNLSDVKKLAYHIVARFVRNTQQLAEFIELLESMQNR